MVKPEMRLDAGLGRWEAYLREFNQQNRARVTRLGVMGVGHGMEDYWLENGLPFAAVSLEARNGSPPTLQIMLGAEGDAGRSVTHTVARVKRLRLQFGVDGRDDGLDVVDADGLTAILRFESRD